MKIRAFALCVLMLAPSAFAEKEKSPVKPGKWQWTMRMEVPQLPVQMPAVKFEGCVTEKDAEDIKNGIPRDKKAKDCTYSDVKVEKGTITWTLDCPEQKMTGKGAITYKGNSMTGKMDLLMNEQEMSAKYTGKFLGACDEE
jgi:hypothetical protein